MIPYTEMQLEISSWFFSATHDLLAFPQGLTRTGISDYDSASDLERLSENKRILTMIFLDRPF